MLPRDRGVWRRRRGAARQIGSPNGVAAGRDGSLYIADIGATACAAHPDGIIRTVAGTGSRGFGGDGGPAMAARFNSANTIAVGGDDSAYIADEFNLRIRVVLRMGRSTRWLARALMRRAVTAVWPSRRLCRHWRADSRSVQTSGVRLPGLQQRARPPHLAG